MSIRDDIASQMRLVVGTSGVGASWQYRKRTSAPTTRPETFGTLTSIAGHQSNRTHENEYDEARNAQKRVEKCTFRCSDALALVVGDQLKDPAGLYWSVQGIRASGIGTVAYECERAVPIKGEPDRGGGA
jgi:hypothetical protein